MKKTYRMMLALVALLLGAVNVSAGERIPLTADNFFSYQGYGLEAVQGDAFKASYIIEQADGCPFGDSSCEARVDLGAYSKLYVNMEGCDGDGNLNGSNPRIFINRTEGNGQFNSDKSASKCIVIPNDGTWAAEYYTKADDGTYIIDLLKIKKEFGFVHLAAIKGSAYNTKAILHSIEVEKASAAQQVGWINMTVNGDLEGSDESSIFPETHYGVDMTYIGIEPGTEVGFYSKTNDSENENAGKVVPSIAEDGVGVDGSRGIRVTAKAKASQDWDAQFWINASEDLPAGAKIRVTFDYCASRNASVDAQAHGTPSCYIFYNCIGANPLPVSTEWQTYTWEDVVPESWATQDDEDKSNFHSIAFNLCKDRDNDIDFFFDNIKFEVYKFGASSIYDQDVIKVDFGFDTNIADLAKKQGVKRVLFPKDSYKVTVNGKALSNDEDVISFEGWDDGKFYIFTEEPLEDGATVQVSFINPADEAYHLLYTSGTNAGSAVANYDGTAEQDEAAMEGDPYAYVFVTPTLMKSNPEANSFNLPYTLSEFELTFDKEVNCAKLQAKIDNQALTVATEGFAKVVKLTRTDNGLLAKGKHTIKIDKIFPEEPLDESIYGTESFTISVGPVEVDPTDVAYDLIPVSLFNDCADGGVPAGFILYADGETPEQRTNASGYGSGARMRVLPDGGDFTKALYMRTWYLSYGELEDAPLELKAGKKYDAQFNLALWCTRNGHSVGFIKMQVIDADGKVHSEMISKTAAPNLNESVGNAVKNSTVFNEQFSVEKDGNYVIKWVICKDENGTPADNDWYDVMLANVRVSYTPDVAGVKETAALEEALAAAVAAREANDDERHHGIDFETLDNAIKKYQAEKENYTGPSQYYDAADELKALTSAMGDHKNLVDTYYDNAGKLQTLIVDNTGSKFEKMDLFQELKGFRDEYGTVTTQKVIGEDGIEVEEEVYTPNALTGNDQLKEANEKITAKLTAAGRMFTEGESKTSSDVGVKVLVDRIRQGVEGMKQLGAADDDELVVEGNNAVTDDDNLSSKIMNRLTMDFYTKMKNGEDLFPATVNEETMEEETPEYNFTVFVKNPNTYAWKENGANIEGDNCPGWEEVDGNNAPGLTSMWNGAYPGDIDGLPKDLCITQYFNLNRIEQTITNLPVGTYKVIINATEWSSPSSFAIDEEKDTEEQKADKETKKDFNRAYVKTSDTPIYEDGQEVPEEFAASEVLDNYGQYSGRHDCIFTDIEVLDGNLTLGVKWNNSQFMFDYVKIFLTGPAAGADYSKEYQDFVDAVDAAAAAATVKSVEFFDINGVQLPVAKKGVNIVKKTMSDGTIITEKIVK